MPTSGQAEELNVTQLAGANNFKFRFKTSALKFSYHSDWSSWYDTSTCEYDHYHITINSLNFNSKAIKQKSKHAQRRRILSNLANQTLSSFGQRS